MKTIVLPIAILIFGIGFVSGMCTGHVQIIKDDGTICAEIK